MSEEAKMIFKSDGQPFANRKAATIQKTILEKQGVFTNLIEVDEDGEKFALEVIKEVRPKREKIGARNVWDPKKDPNFEYRGVNHDPNKPGRMEMFKRAGWEVVTGDDPACDNRVGRTSIPGSAVAIPGGGSITMVLMRKRRDWFEEDMAEKQAAIDKSEKLLKQQAQVDNLHAASGYNQGIEIKDQG